MKHIFLFTSIALATNCAEHNTRFIARHYHNPYAETEAYVRTTPTLSAEETAYLHTRHPITKKALEALLHISLHDDEVPRIAFCHSGGGYRALIASLGALSAADQEALTRSARDLWHTFNNTMHAIAYALHLIPSPPAIDNATQAITSQKGLLDAVTYNASLSGSAWAVAGWVDSGLPVHEYLAHITTRINRHILVEPDLTDLAAILLEKQYYKQSISLVDCFGALVAQKILVRSPNTTPLMSRRASIDNGALPFPLYTAIIGDEGSHEHSWIEFTPYEIGSAELRSFIPTWAFGRTFNAGVSRDFATPQKLSYGIGIWGSAMSITVEEFFNNLLPTPRKRSLFDYRISPARVPNWTLNMKKMPLNTKKHLTLIDAGIDFNLPLPPLLRPERAVDIIIVYDASNSPLGDELRKAEQWAYQHNYPFPPINEQDITAPCSIHRHTTGAKAPIIIYLPLVKNPAYHDGWDPFTAHFAGTFDFEYTQEQVALLSGLMAFNLLSSRDMILETIREWIMEKRDMHQNA